MDFAAPTFRGAVKAVLLPHLLSNYFTIVIYKIIKISFKFIIFQRTSELIFLCKYAHVITYKYSRTKLYRNHKQLLRK